MPERSGLSTERPPLVLASASPRRRWLLENLGVAFEVFAVDVDERPRAGEAPAAFARRMAEEKAAGARIERPHTWVLAADTVVALGDEPFGKPGDAAEAVSMLERLSGRRHVVYTGVTLLAPDGAVAVTEVIATQVTFRSLSPADVRRYVATGEPFDRAGAYAIQGEGAHLVARVDGSYTNVIGLPVPEVAEWLRERGIL
jgi:nucleoside triphosphate pyrophosphatase